MEIRLGKSNILSRESACAVAVADDVAVELLLFVVAIDGVVVGSSSSSSCLNQIIIPNCINRHGHPLYLTLIYMWAASIFI